MGRDNCFEKCRFTPGLNIACESTQPHRKESKMDDTQYKISEEILKKLIESHEEGELGIEPISKMIAAIEAMDLTNAEVAARLMLSEEDEHNLSFFQSPYIIALQLQGGIEFILTKNKWLMGLCERMASVTGSHPEEYKVAFDEQLKRAVEEANKIQAATGFILSTLHRHFRAGARAFGGATYTPVEPKGPFFNPNRHFPFLNPDEHFFGAHTRADIGIDNPFTRSSPWNVAPPRNADYGVEFDGSTPRFRVGTRAFGGPTYTPSPRWDEAPFQKEDPIYLALKEAMRVAALNEDPLDFGYIVVALRSKPSYEDHPETRYIPWCETYTRIYRKLDIAGMSPDGNLKKEKNAVRYYFEGVLTPEGMFFTPHELAVLRNGV